MTSHELARQLLKQPDKPIMYQEETSEGSATLHSWVEVIAIHYDNIRQRVLLV